MLQIAPSRFRKSSQILSSVFFPFSFTLPHKSSKARSYKHSKTVIVCLGSWKMKVRRVNGTFEKWSQD